MPNAQDAELTELYTAPVDENVEDNEPNTPAPAAGAVNEFDLRLQAVAGAVRGNDGSEYSLRADCIDESISERNGSMSIGPLTQRFDANTGNDWVLVGPTTGNFVKEQTFRIPVDAAAKGHVLRYVASLVSTNGDIVSFIESNKFILV
jgi:hypothetical protein